MCQGPARCPRGQRQWPLVRGSRGSSGPPTMSEAIDLRALFNVFLCYTLLHIIAMVGRSGKRRAHKAIRERERFDQKTGAVTVRLACSPHEYTLQTNHDRIIQLELLKWGPQNATREDHSS